MPGRTLKTLAMLSALAVSASAGIAHAYPDRPVTLVVPAVAGSFSDLVGREFGQRLSDALSVPVPIDNRGGASGTIAYRAVMAAEPDGYTLLLTNTGPSAMNVELFREQGLGYDPVTDFAPITLLTRTPLVLVVSASAPWETFEAFLADATSRPGELSFATTGQGQLNHLSAVLLGTVAGIDAEHIPYSGAPDALADVMSGDIDYMFYPPASARALVEDGRLRALAVTSANPTISMPDVPPLASFGFDAFDLSAWFGIAVPAATPRPVIDALRDAARAIASDADYIARLHASGMDDMAEHQSKRFEDLQAFHAEQVELWVGLLKMALGTAD